MRSNKSLEQSKFNIQDKAQFDRDIKRINTRLTAIVDKFGINSPEYKSQIASLTIESYKPYVKVLESGKHVGVLQLKGSEIKKLVGTKTEAKLRNDIMRYGSAVKTTTGIKATALESIGIDDYELEAEEIDEITHSYWANRGNFENAWVRFYEENNQKFLDIYKDDEAFKPFFLTKEEGRSIGPEELRKATERIDEILNNMEDIYEDHPDFRKYLKNNPFN